MLLNFLLILVHALHVVPTDEPVQAIAEEVQVSTLF